MVTAQALGSIRPLPSEAQLQLLFSLLNAHHFGGVLPAHRIRYNSRLTSIAGRIIYRASLIELSSTLLEHHSDHIEPTLLHEMVHAWLHQRGLPSGHGRAFKKKMNDVGLASIYHSMPVKNRRSRRRYVLRCPSCYTELIRRRRPGTAVSCARCFPAGYNARFRMSVRKG